MKRHGLMLPMIRRRDGPRRQSNCSSIRFLSLWAEKRTCSVSVPSRGGAAQCSNHLSAFLPSGKIKKGAPFPSRFILMQAQKAC